MSVPRWPRFTLSADGTSIAYDVAGEGSSIVFCNGYATSHFYWEDVRDHFKWTHQTVTWDLRGHGRSGPARDLSTVTIPGCADDLLRVLDAAEIDRAVLAGFSLGCQIIFEAWRQFPDRISALVPVLGTYGRPFDNLLHPAVGRQLYKAFRNVGPKVANRVMPLVNLNMKSPLTHRIGQVTGMLGAELKRERMQPFYDHFEMIDGPTWVALGIHAQEHSAEDILHTIDVPTLIISGGRDIFTPQRLSLQMHQTIPNAEILMLPNATHAGLIEHADTITKRFDDFLKRHELS